MSPKVSVIVPVYNVSEYLGQCLDSILLQTLQDIEVICINDGSTDDSLDILQGYAMFDERLKIISQENAGCAIARNNGIKHATGEYIIFLDGDDFFHPQMLEKMVQKAEENASDIVICGHTLFDNIREQDYEERSIDAYYLKQSPINPKNLKNDLFFCRGYLWEKLIKRNLITNNNLIFSADEVQSDLPFVYTTMALAQKISLLPDNFVHYRLKRSGQLTQRIHDKDFRFFTPWIRLWDNLKKYQLTYFSEAFKTALLRELSWTLYGRDTSNKKHLLQYFNEKLPNEIKNLFGYGNNQAKISLIIPVYNVAPFLPECLDSCINQTLKEIEIICVDDGSTDNSLEILNEYTKKDSRIKVIHQENQGLSITRNNAIKIATGEYIQYLDSDDYLEPDTCECLYLYSKIYDLDMLSFAAIEFKNDTRLEYETPYHCIQWLPEKFMPVFTWEDVSNILPQLAVTSPLTIYRHQYLIDNNISWINKKIAYEDTPFFTESLLKGARMGALPIKFYHKRVHGDAITQNMSSNFSDYCWIVKHTLDKIKKINQNQTIFTIYFYTFLQKVYLNYLKFDKDIKEKNIEHFFNLCFDLQKRYHLPITEDIIICFNDYLKNNRFPKKCTFSFYALWAKWKANKYAISPIKITFTPFSLSLFGITISKLILFISMTKKHINPPINTPD